jgi:hypothetical protein
MIVLMMEVARFSETLVNFYKTTRRYNPEYSHLSNQSRENIKSYLTQNTVIDVPPAPRGIPHFSRHITEFQNKQIPNRWIGRGAH